MMNIPDGDNMGYDFTSYELMDYDLKDCQKEFIFLKD